jgi:hypothetical protein
MKLIKVKYSYHHALLKIIIRVVEPSQPILLTRQTSTGSVSLSWESTNRCHLFEFQQMFLGERACAAYLEAICWSDGFD